MERRGLDGARKARYRYYPNRDCWGYEINMDVPREPEPIPGEADLKRAVAMVAKLEGMIFGQKLPDDITLEEIEARILILERE